MNRIIYFIHKISISIISYFPAFFAFVILFFILFFSTKIIVDKVKKQNSSKKNSQISIAISSFVFLILIALVVTLVDYYLSKQPF